VITKIKGVCSSKAKKKGEIKEERQKKIWMTSRVKLLIVIFSLWNPETLFEPYESFSFIAKNHSLRYVPVEVLSNQASKQPRTINNALKMQRILFIRFMTSRINYVLLFMLIKTNVQKETSFSHTKPRTFSRAFHFETKGHLMMYFHWRPHYQTQEQIISFPRKNNQGVARFQKQIVLGSHRNNFCFQNARSGFQALFSTHIPSPKWKNERMVF
jgi:hypothetical protein